MTVERLLESVTQTTDQSALQVIRYLCREGCQPLKVQLLEFMMNGY